MYTCTSATHGPVRSNGYPPLTTPSNPSNGRLYACCTEEASIMMRLSPISAGKGTCEYPTAQHTHATTNHPTYQPINHPKNKKAYLRNFKITILRIKTSFVQPIINKRIVCPCFKDGSNHTTPFGRSSCSLLLARHQDGMVEHRN